MGATFAPILPQRIRRHCVPVEKYEKMCRLQRASHSFLYPANALPMPAAQKSPAILGLRSTPPRPHFRSPPAPTNKWNIPLDPICQQPPANSATSRFLSDEPRSNLLL